MAAKEHIIGIISHPGVSNLSLSEWHYADFHDQEPGPFCGCTKLH